MIRFWFLFCLPALFTSCSGTLSEDAGPEFISQEEIVYSRYERSELQKMNWLAGDWKGTDLRHTFEQSFRFLPGDHLEIHQIAVDGQKTDQSFQWELGNFYFGGNRQWIVTWIGEKDIRLDPLAPGLRPMTWTRLNDQTWHLVRHLDKGDETIVMERVADIPS